MEAIHDSEVTGIIHSLIIHYQIKHFVTVNSLTFFNDEFCPRLILCVEIFLETASDTQWC